MTHVLSGALFEDWEGSPITEITRPDVHLGLHNGATRKNLRECTPPREL